MIIYWLLVILVGTLLFFVQPLSVLPNATLPANITTAISQTAGFIGLVWHFFPLTLAALMGAVAAIVITENWVMIYKVIRWVYQKIPGVN